MSEENKENKPRARIVSERAKGAQRIATSVYAMVEGKPFSSALYNGQVIFTTDKNGKELNLLGDVISKEQIAAENARTAKYHEYLARKALKDGKAEKIAEGFCEKIQVSDATKAKILKMSAPTKNPVLQKTMDVYS